MLALTTELSKLRLAVYSEGDRRELIPSGTAQRLRPLKLQGQSEMWCEKQEMRSLQGAYIEIIGILSASLFQVFKQYAASKASTLHIPTPGSKVEVY